MQRDRSQQSFSVQYILVYRHIHTNIVYDLIKPFTQDDMLFQKLLETVIFVDTETPHLEFTDLMQSEFSKIHSSPALICVVGGNIITDCNTITEIMSDIYNDCVNSLTSVLMNPFDNSICERDDHYISEQLFNPSIMYTTDSSNFNDYVAQYQQDNQKRENLQFPPQPVCDGDITAQIKDTPMKSVAQLQTSSKQAESKVNLSDMKLDI